MFAYIEQFYSIQNLNILVSFDVHRFAQNLISRAFHVHSSVGHKYVSNEFILAVTYLNCKYSECGDPNAIYLFHCTTQTITNN